jgi:rhamnosyl/mannosyltransferase
MRYYKGIEYLLDAARQSGLPVVLAGAISDDLRLAEAPPNVRILGEVSEAEKEALLQLCQAFVLPSHLRSEAFGVSLLEAARAGRPMISCELGTGTTFVNLHNVTGLAVPAADAGALAHAMMTMANAGEASLQMGRNAQARFEAMFTADAMATRYLALYRELCGTA